MAKTIYTHQHVDYETGELKSSSWVRGRRMNTESFVRAYIEDIGMLARCSKSEMTTVLCCLKYVDWDTNEIVLNAQRRVEISECGVLSINTVNCAISRLIKKNIFVKDNKRILLNPTLFFFGSDLGRSKVLELKLVYTLNED